MVARMPALWVCDGMHARLVQSIGCLAIIAIFALAPATAQAHAVERGLILLLPTQYYLWGGACAVLGSVLVLALLPAQATKPLLSWNAALPAYATRAVPWVQAISFILFALTLAAGFQGPADPLRNPLPLMTWTVLWIGLAMLCAVFGDIWHLINPWSFPMRILRRATPPLVRLPRQFGSLPAVLCFGMIIWFESISLAPSDPRHLATVLLVYWALHLGAMVIFGEAQWRTRGEAVSIFFARLSQTALLSRTGHTGHTDHHWQLSWPGAGLCKAPTLSMTGSLFVCAMIAGVTFDGLAGTFWWLGLIGVNPLDYPGRSSVQLEGTIGLLGVWLAFSVTFAGAILTGCQLGNASFRPAMGRLVLSLIPIAVAYHSAHYLTFFLVNGQYALVALSDPFGSGTDWLGLGPHFVTTGFLNTLDSVERIWRAQVALIVGGHLIGVLVAHIIAVQVFPSARQAVLGQIPLALMMVGMTVLGLWLLSTPTAV